MLSDVFLLLPVICDALVFKLFSFLCLTQYASLTYCDVYACHHITFVVFVCYAYVSILMFLLVPSVGHIFLVLVYSIHLRICEYFTIPPPTPFCGYHVLLNTLV